MNKEDSGKYHKIFLERARIVDSVLILLGDATPNDPTNVGDRHTLAIDQSDCRLYETFATQFLSNGFTVDSSAIYDMKKRLPQRPDDVNY